MKHRQLQICYESTCVLLQMNGDLLNPVNGFKKNRDVERKWEGEGTADSRENKKKNRRIMT